MKDIFQRGDQKEFKKIVSQNELASFDNGIVHEVYSTFAIARDAEWSGRLFVLDMKENDEEGIGTSISVEHRSPAFVGQEIKYVATFIEITSRGEITTSFQAFCGERLIASGLQGQRILKKERIEQLFSEMKS